MSSPDLSLGFLITLYLPCATTRSPTIYKSSGENVSIFFLVVFFRVLCAWYVFLSQASFSAVERCPQPVIAAIHGICIGGAVDLVCACDMRLCSEDARFCVAEVKVGLAADVGTLQRMPRVRSNRETFATIATVILVTAIHTRKHTQFWKPSMYLRINNAR